MPRPRRTLDERRSGDFLAEVSLYRTDDGGRQTAIRPPHHACPLDVGGELFDCRIHLRQPIEPGAVSVVRIQFLFPELVQRVLMPNQRFKLWEGRFIGEGQVLRVCE